MEPNTPDTSSAGQSFPPPGIPQTETAEWAPEPGNSSFTLDSASGIDAGTAWEPLHAPADADAGADAGSTTTPVFDLTAAARLLQRIRSEVCQVLVGQPHVVDQVLVAFIAGGHILLEGKPGLGKTHLVLALARTFGGQFRRIQFTPDLMPSDVTGHSLYDMGQQEFRIKAGPVFTNLLLADEINRAPAKTQAALLEVMQESQVTIDGQTLPISAPFMTLATQNPIEQEGTYALPEAQLDRFLLKVDIDYPSAADEESIVAGVTGSGGPDGPHGSGDRLSLSRVSTFASVEDILRLQSLASQVKCVAEVISYAVRLVRATRETPGMALGAGTRGAIALVRAAKAFALLAGRHYVIPDDVKDAALPALRHRVSLAPELAISGQRVDDLLSSLIRTVEAPR
jgi:MoxR-like ATPase